VLAAVRLWFDIGMRAHHQASGRPRRVVGALAAAAYALTLTVTGTASAAAASAGPGATTTTVTAGPARSLGEPFAAQDTSVSAVAATSFGAEGARVEVWARRASAAAWGQPALFLPAGFGSSYDASAAAVPGGPLLVVAGTAPPGESCITHGSVAIANVESGGRLGRPRLVSDQRGTGSFDDRPAVAIGQGGTVWVAWSQGPNSDACQNVGTGDRLKVAVSRDGGLTFGAPVTMPAGGGGSAFGARLAPLPGGRVAVSWTETTARGEAVLVSVLGPARQVSAPQQVLTGSELPLALPGASFYDFPAGDIVALPGGRLVVAVPFWRDGRSVIALAAGTPGGPWRTSAVDPPAGSDLLLPALGLVSASDVRLLCAAHTRSGDRLGYQVADIRVAAQGTGIVAARLAPLTPAPAGPGFFEIGEELSLARTPAGLIASFVVAGGHGAALETATFKDPLPATGTATASPSATATRAAGTAPSATATHPGPATAAGPRASGSGPGPAVTVAWTAATVVLGAVVLGAWRLRRRRLRHG